MGDKKRIVYTEWNEPRVVFVPPGGFPLERLRGYVDCCKQERPLKPAQVRDFVELLCDDGLIASLSEEERRLVEVKVKPTVNSFLQPRARAIREARKQN